MVTRWRAALSVLALVALTSGCSCETPVTPSDAGTDASVLREDAGQDGGVDAGPQDAAVDAAPPCGLMRPQLPRAPRDGRLPADLIPPC